MARAQKRKWIDFVGGLLVGAAAQPLALLAGPDAGSASLPTVVDRTELVVAQLGGGSARARMALNAGIDAERLGDLDKAAALYHEAQARVNDLTPDEQRELDRRINANALALQARREAREQLGLAESAFQHGRPADAAALLKKITAKELYLSPADKQRFQSLCQRMHVQAGASSSGNASAVAHDKIRQARAELAQANLDAAEALILQVEQMPVSFEPREDTPGKIRADLDKARGDAKTLLSASRAALQRAELDAAEKYARAAEKLASPFTFMVGDSPAKVLKDIQSARSQVPPSRDRQGAVASANSLPLSGRGAEHAAAQDSSSNTEKARALVRQGREAFARGDVVLARKCAEQASALNAQMHWSEDNPDRLLADLAHAGGGSALSPVAEMSAMGGATVAPIKTKEEAQTLLKQGREQLAKGQLEDANKTAARLRSARHIHWGLFVDTPDKFQSDVDKARSQRDRHQAGELLAEARRRFEKKDFAGAEKLAYEARTKHGPYSIWDLGDRPDKLLADVQVARQHQRPAKLPDPPTTPRQMADLSHGPLAPNGNNALAQNNPAPSAGGTGIVPAGGIVPPQQPSDSQSMAPARSPSGAPVAPVPPAQPAANTPQATSPYLAIQPQNEGKGSADSLVAQTRARRLMGEARGLQQQNRLLEARDKIEEARRLGVSFRPDEESPSQAYQQLAFLARQRIDSLVQHASDTLQRGTQAPTLRCQDAERELTQARQLAAAFGLDMQPIDAAMRMVSQLRATGNTTLVGTTPELSRDPMGGALASGARRNGGSGHPMQLLDQARLELRSGQTANARRFAEEAVKLGAGEDGLAVLRSIDAEEDAQSRRRANRAFDNVVQSYQNHDYRRASLLLASIDTTKLDPRRRSRLREMTNTPEMQLNAQGIALTGAQQPAAPAGQASPSDPQAGHARATDDPGQSLLDRTRAMREIKFQQLRKEGLDVQSQALERFRTGQTDVAVDMLQEHLARLAEEQLDPAQLALLRRPIDSRLQQFQLLKAQAELANNRFDERSRQVKADIAKAKSSEQVKQKNIQALMKRYNELFKEAKYPEAEMVALQVKELDPDNPMAAAAITMAKFQRNHNQYESDKERKQDVFLEAMHGTDDLGEPDAIREGIAFTKDQKRLEAIRGRKSLEGLPLQRKTAEERNILRKLSEPVSLSFTNEPLSRVIEYIRGDQGINIFVDEPAIADKGIQLDSRVTIKLDNVALKSALKLVLNLAHLTYVVSDDVLKITTEDQARGKLEQRVFPVTDLVVAVENFGQVGVTPNPAEQLGMVNVNQALSQTRPPMAMIGPNGMPFATMPSIPAGSSQANAAQTGFASDPSGGNVQVTKQRPHTHEDMLIKLITSTIAPHSWAEQGGAGTLEFHPMTMALVVNQTPDIQDQIQDLLNALRRLIDQEVAVEVKFISIAEDFFERIGVNFNLNILNKSRSALQAQPELIAGQFANPAYINFFAPNNLVSGLTPAGTLTSDLNIPISQLTYPQAVPPFGGYPGIPGYGGLTMGLAFLSDIQVFLFMEAVAGDTRTNVMQAPKLTLFNGQTANIAINDFQFFTIGVSVDNGGFGQVVYNPITTLFPLNIILTIQAVISGDRRFVRLSMAPSLANVVNGEVNLFPVVTPIFPLFDGTATGQPVVFTQFIQQPRLTRVAVNTTVAVPDGGTVLMGGLKRLSEGRNEFGPPVLSKIPYLSRLFRNIGYGRSAESLLIMVTPRIIIQAEEEVTQTGYTPPPAIAP